MYEKYLEGLKGVPGIKLLYPSKNVTHPNYSYFPIVIDESIYGKERNELFEILKQYNVFSRKYFYPLITDFDCFREVNIGHLT